jgi:hypothetical protein
MNQYIEHTLPIVALELAAGVMVLGWSRPEAHGVAFGLGHIGFPGTCSDARTQEMKLLPVEL